MEINKYWLCDEGRFNFRYVHAGNRVADPMKGAAKTDWSSGIDAAKAALGGKKTTILVGSDLTQEEAKSIQDFFAKALPGSTLFHFGTPGIGSVAADAPADKILKRKSKTSNLNGLEQDLRTK